jgi:hypothetical protein
MSNYWNGLPKEKYEAMAERHQPLWDFVQKFITDHNILSVLEVGCGLASPVPKWVEHHTGIDLNEQTHALHVDFMQLRPTLPVQFELLLACAVIEHIESGYEPFIEHVLRFSPKFALISFFNGLYRDQNYLRVNPKGVWKNRYSKVKLQTYMDSRRVDYEIIALARKEDVLIIKGE